MNKSSIRPYVLKSDHPIFDVPEDKVIARYFDWDKTQKLIDNPGIWFSCFDAMSDDREGDYFEGFRSRLQSFTAAELDSIQAASRLAHMPLISCWTDFFEGESQRMWQDYVGASNGICCVTDVGTLRKSFELTEIPCGKVVYYDEVQLDNPGDSDHICRPVFYDNDIETRTYWSNELVKRSQFSFEKEYRFICFVDGKLLNSQTQGGYLVRFADLKTRPPFRKIIAGAAVPVDMRRKLKQAFCCEIISSSIRVGDVGLNSN